MAAPFDLSVAEGIGCITFNRPKSLNSLTFEVYRELVRFFEDARRDPSLKVVVLTF